MTFSNRPKIERAVKTFMIDQVEKEASTQFGITDLPDPSLLIDSLISDLPPDVSPKEYFIIEQNQIKEMYIRKIIASGNTKESTQDYRSRAHIRANYQRVFNGFIHEFRIFTGINCIFFSLAFGLLSCLTTRMGYLLRAVIVVAATNCMAIAIYVFAQNWLTAILTQDFIGYWYFIYFGVTAVLLVDIVCNNARILLKILNIRRFWHYFY